MESDRPDSLLLDILRRLWNVKEAAKTKLFNLILKLNLRQPEMDIDRLSALPDSLLIDILRRLPSVKEAAKTAVLSKQWRFLWTNMSDFTFKNTSRDPDEIERFIAGVRAAAAASPQKLSVFFCYDKRLASNIDAVLNTTAKSGVKELNLILNPIYTRQAGWAPYTLPQAIYSHSQLKKLSLEGYCNVAAAAVEWRSMTHLVIQSTELTQRAVDAIVSGCPVLMELVLLKCRGFNRLEIRGKSFRRLKVDGGCWGIDADAPEQLLEISAPYMRELAIHMAPRRTKLRLTDSSSLEVACFGFVGWRRGGLISDGEMLWTGDLFNKIRRLSSLQLNPDCLKLLSMMRRKGWRFPESRIKELKIIDAYHEVYDVLAIIRSMPFLERLSVENSTYKDESMKWDPNVLADLDHDLSHLKTVQIEISVHADISGELLFTLAQIMLKRAPILRKMAIRVRTRSQTPGSDELIKKFQTLLAYPRSSQKAVLDISWSGTSDSVI